MQSAYLSVRLYFFLTSACQSEYAYICLNACLSVWLQASVHICLPVCSLRVRVSTNLSERFQAAQKAAQSLI